MKQIDYWSPGTKLFVNITSSRSRPVSTVTSTTCQITVTSTTCQIVESWDEAFSVVRKFLENNRFVADTVTVFTKPRLCWECMKHAVQPMIFDNTEHIQECLCKLQGTPCGVHGGGR